MSVTLATMADALIEFILSLLRDPEAAAEFEEDPEGAMAARGLNNVSYADVCSVAPVIAEKPHVIVNTQPAPVPVGPKPEWNPVVKEIKSITTQLSYTHIDDRDTIVDQSVNQNIWANGDVNQTFGNEAVVASGDDAIAAGNDVDQDTTLDNSTDINAGNDVNIGNDETNTDIDGSYNDTDETTETTDNSTDVDLTDSANDSSTDVVVDDSFNDTTDTTVDTSVDEDTTVVFDSGNDVIIEDTSDDTL
ncbi:IniB N-terminal domain-containing protein [uncultured Microbacterium sp.]|uniref:IniB N-terminal domain-containing protein n=1 Tax=uncultured Microbacterium sp. TaxID=191216 RepID=UPI0028D8044E|nr:IniB N-terminal domain-containing protein [uncultured Microbacterium sp.]